MHIKSWTRDGAVSSFICLAATACRLGCNQAAVSLLTPKAELEAQLKLKAKFAGILVWAAKVLAEYPSLKDLVSQGLLSKTSPSQAALRSTHKWQWEQGLERWWCPGCLATSNKVTSKIACIKWSQLVIDQLQAWTACQHKIARAQLKQVRGKGR